MHLHKRHSEHGGTEVLAAFSRVSFLPSTASFTAQHPLTLLWHLPRHCSYQPVCCVPPLVSLTRHMCPWDGKCWHAGTAFMASLDTYTFWQLCNPEPCFSFRSLVLILWGLFQWLVFYFLCWEHESIGLLSDDKARSYHVLKITLMLRRIRCEWFSLIILLKIFWKHAYFF